jgi:hypothetical protein
MPGAGAGMAAPNRAACLYSSCRSNLMPAITLETAEPSIELVGNVVIAHSPSKLLAGVL